MTRFIPLLTLVLLAGCGGGDPGGTAGEVTSDEARALDEAAEMIEARNLPQKALPPMDSEQPAVSPSPAAGE